MKFYSYYPEIDAAIPTHYEEQPVLQTKKMPEWHIVLQDSKIMNTLTDFLNMQQVHPAQFKI